MPTTLDFDSIWDYSNPQKTEDRFCEILLQIPDSEPAFLELLTQIARAQGLQRKFNKAHQTLDQVEKRLGTVASREKVRYLLERGRVLNTSGKPDEARPYFEQTLDTATKIGDDFYAVDALHMLAIVAAPASSLDFNLRAIQLAESSGQEKARSWLGSLYNNTGWSLHDLGEYESALEIFQKAEAFFRSQGREAQTRIAIWTVARCLRSLNRIEEALCIQMKLKEEYSFADGTDGYVFEEIGECLIALGRTDESKPYFVRAYDELSKDEYLAEHEPERLKRLNELGNN